MRKAVPLGLAVAGIALGEVYIVDPSIDQYKQKTDQAFYDLYQNRNSVIARGIRAHNPVFKPDAVSTDQRLFSGSNLPDLPIFTDYNSVLESGAGVFGGAHRKGCWVDARSLGLKVSYAYEVNDLGKVKKAQVAVQGAYRYRYGWRPTSVRGDWTYGVPAFPDVGLIGVGKDASGVTCVATCGGGCVRQRKNVYKLTLDTACRIGTLHVTYVERTRRCWRCGKSTCYGPWSDWYEVAGGRVADQLTLSGSVVKGASLRGGSWIR